MNTLTKDKKVAVLGALVEGNSLRAITRMTGVHRTTLTNLLIRVGEGCAAMMDERLQDLTCDNVQIDEIWTYIGKKQSHLTPDEKHQTDKGDQYVFVALDADTKSGAVLVDRQAGPHDRPCTHARPGLTHEASAADHHRWLPCLQHGDPLRFSWARRLGHSGQALRWNRCGFREVRPTKGLRNFDYRLLRRPSPGGDIPRPTSSGRTSQCGCT